MNYRETVVVTDAPAAKLVTNPPIVITLVGLEIMQAYCIGAMRRLLAKHLNRSDTHIPATDELAWSQSVNSAGGEIAVAKHTNHYWTGSAVDWAGSKEGDVGPLQVRTTEYPNGDLIIRDRDPEGCLFVHVTGLLPRYHLRGFLLSEDAKQAKYLRNPGGQQPAYFVPIRVLKPMSELETELSYLDIPF